MVTKLPKSVNFAPFWSYLSHLMSSMFFRFSMLLFMMFRSISESFIFTTIRFRTLSFSMFLCFFHYFLHILLIPVIFVSPCVWSGVSNIFELQNIILIIHLSWNWVPVLNVSGSGSWVKVIPVFIIIGIIFLRGRKPNISLLGSNRNLSWSLLNNNSLSWKRSLRNVLIISSTVVRIPVPIPIVFKTGVVLMRLVLILSQIPVISVTTLNWTWLNSQTIICGIIIRKIVRTLGNQTRS